MKFGGQVKRVVKYFLLRTLLCRDKRSVELDSVSVFCIGDAKRVNTWRQYQSVKFIENFQN